MSLFSRPEPTPDPLLPLVDRIVIVNLSSNEAFRGRLREVRPDMLVLEDFGVFGTDGRLGGAEGRAHLRRDIVTWIQEV